MRKISVIFLFLAFIGGCASRDKLFVDEDLSIISKKLPQEVALKYLQELDERAWKDWGEPESLLFKGKRVHPFNQKTMNIIMYNAWSGKITNIVEKPYTSLFYEITMVEDTQHIFYSLFEKKANGEIGERFFPITTSFYFLFRGGTNNRMIKIKKFAIALESMGVSPTPVQMLK